MKKKIKQNKKNCSEFSLPKNHQKNSKCAQQQKKRIKYKKTRYLI